MTFFTIVTVSRNNRRGLRQTAQSVSEQTFRNFQWIIIDGASCDRTDEDLAGYDATILREPDAGPYDAMNKGLSLALGEYIIFMNSGDAFADHTILHKIYDAAVKTMPDFIYGDSWETDGSRISYKAARSAEKINQGMFTHHQSMFYKRSLIQHLKYDYSYKIAADYDFTLRFLNKSRTILYFPEPVCVFLGGGLSQKNVLLGRHEQLLIRKKNSSVSYFSNHLIYFIQSVLWILRTHCPGLYWKLKESKLRDDT